jgi:uridine kinase
MVKASTVLEVAALVAALVAAAAATRTRARRSGRLAVQQMLDVGRRELELVKDIVYFDTSVEQGTPKPRAPAAEPDYCAPHFTLERRPNSSTALNDEGNPILVVGVCGGSGSGKTTLSRAIISEFGASRVSYLSHDYYYKDLGHLSMAQRAEHNFDHPDSLETDLLVQHLRQLRAGKAVDVPVYDFGTHSRCPETRTMQPNSVILVEGILIFADQALADLMDIKIFVETAADIRLVRRLRRDMEERARTAESVMNQYMKTVRPMHMMFVEQSKRVADIIIPHGVNSVALDMIISRLHSFTAAATSSSGSTSSLDDEVECEPIADKEDQVVGCL